MRRFSVFSTSKGPAIPFFVSWNFSAPVLRCKTCGGNYSWSAHNHDSPQCAPAVFDDKPFRVYPTMVTQCPPSVYSGSPDFSNNMRKHFTVLPAFFLDAGSSFFFIHRHPFIAHFTSIISPVQASGNRGTGRSMPIIYPMPGCGWNSKPVWLWYRFAAVFNMVYILCRASSICSNCPSPSL